MTLTESLKERLSIHDLVVLAAMSGLDHVLAEVISQSMILPETRLLALRLAHAGERHSTVGLLTLH